MFSSITEALNIAVSMKQKDNEILLNYSKRLKQAKDILESHVGEDILGPQIERNGIRGDNKALPEAGRWLRFIPCIDRTARRTSQVDSNSAHRQGIREQ